MTSKRLAVFSSDYSIGNSILTLSPPKEKDWTKPLVSNSPISIFSIAKKHGLSELFVVDEAITGFFEALPVSKELGIPLYFGWKVAVVEDATNKKEESLSTESKVIIWITNDDAYYKLVKYYTVAGTDNFYYHKRLDWKTLREMWDKDFQLSIPFYSSFSARNATKYGHVALPNFGDIRPFIHLEEHDLPFDGLLRRKILNWNKEYNFPILETFTSNYYREADRMAALTNRLVQDGGTWEKPEQSHWSGRFDFEYFWGKSLDT